MFLLHGPVNQNFVQLKQITEHNGHLCSRYASTNIQQTFRKYALNYATFFTIDVPLENIVPCQCEILIKNIQYEHHFQVCNA